MRRGERRGGGEKRGIFLFFIRIVVFHFSEHTANIKISTVLNIRRSLGRGLLKTYFSAFHHMNLRAMAIPKTHCMCPVFHREVSFRRTLYVDRGCEEWSCMERETETNKPEGLQGLEGSKGELIITVSALPSSSETLPFGGAVKQPIGSVKRASLTTFSLSLNTSFFPASLDLNLFHGFPSTRRTPSSLVAGWCVDH